MTVVAGYVETPVDAAGTPRVWPGRSSPDFVTPPLEQTVADLFSDHLAWVQLPELGSYARSIVEIRELTTWSFRQLADILGTSHTTVGRLANDAAVTGRSRAAADRIGPLLDFLSRLARVVEPGEKLVAVLQTPSPTRQSPIDLLAAGEWSRAFLGCLDALQGPRPERPTAMRDTVRLAATRELL